MAGYSRLFVIGGLGGFQGADGVNPIAFQILVGDASRMRLESHYFDHRIRPLGKVNRTVPAGPNDPNALLDACIAFYPQFFSECASMSAIRSAIGDTEMLDFDSGESIPAQWSQLREEARPKFAKLNLWRADLVPVSAVEESAA